MYEVDLLRLYVMSENKMPLRVNGIYRWTMFNLFETFCLLSKIKQGHFSFIWILKIRLQLLFHLLYSFKYKSRILHHNSSAESFYTNHQNLQLQISRWNRPMKWCPWQWRKVTLCNKNDLVDDFHYLMKCSSFETERKELLRPYYYKRPNIIKFQDLLNCNSKTPLTKLSKFTKIIMNKLSSEAS